MISIVEDFLWGVRPIVQWLSEQSGWLANILRPVNITEYKDEPSETIQLDAKDVNNLNSQMQRVIGKLHAENVMLKNEREVLVKKLYEDNVLHIGKELTEQMDTLARTILNHGEITQFKQLPLAISSGRNHTVLGRLLAISKYNSRYYPILLKDGKLQIVTQGVGAYEDVIRTLEGGGPDNYPYAVISYDEDGKYVPKTYLMV